jgi:hypothetical protein
MLIAQAKTKNQFVASFALFRFPNDFSHLINVLSFVFTSMLMSGSRKEPQHFGGNRDGAVTRCGPGSKRPPLQT